MACCGKKKRNNGGGGTPPPSFQLQFTTGSVLIGVRGECYLDGKRYKAGQTAHIASQDAARLLTEGAPIWIF